MNFRTLWATCALVLLTGIWLYPLSQAEPLSALVSNAGPDLIVPIKPEYQYMRGVSGLLEFDGGSCSASSFGFPGQKVSHTLLTAGHCMTDNPEVIRYRGETGHVLKIVDDGSDHALVLTDMDFPVWAEIGPGLVVGQDVMLFGNPGPYENLFRKGYVAGSHGPYVILDFNGFWGDSGSALFNAQNQIVGMTTEIRIESKELDGSPTPMKFMAAAPFRFTPDQLGKFR